MLLGGLKVNRSMFNRSDFMKFSKFLLKNLTLGDFFNRLRSDKKGSILSIVVIIGACLFIVASALLMRVDNTTQVGKQVTYSENAYLAAKSGLKMLEDEGKSNDTFAANIYNSIAAKDKSWDAISPIKMDFSELGGCQIKLREIGPISDDSGAEIGKTVEVSCTGEYEGRTFLLSREMEIIKSTTTTPSEPTKITKVDPAALKVYDSNDFVINGGATGNVMALGDGDIILSNTTAVNPANDLLVKNSLTVSTSAQYIDSITAGKSVYIPNNVKIKGDVNVGREGVSNPFIFMNISYIGGTLNSEGDVILAGQGSVNSTVAVESNNATADERYGNNTTCDEDAIKSGGNVYLGYSVKYTSLGEGVVGFDLDGDGNYQLNSKGQWEVNQGPAIYGNVKATGDVYIADQTKILGDVVSGGDVYILGYPTIVGNIYCAGNVHYTGGVVMGNIYCNGTMEYTGYSYNMGNCFKGSIYCQSFNWIGKADWDNIAYSSVSVTESDKVDEAVNETKKVVATANFVKADDYFKSATNDNLNPPLTYFPSDSGYLTLTAADFPVSGTGVPVVKSYNGRITAIATHTVSQHPMMYISNSCVIDSDVNYIGNIYIDTSRLNSTEDGIDIFLRGKLSTAGADRSYSFVVNDSNGDKRIRIFMYDGSSIDLSGQMRNVYVADNNNYVVNVETDALQDISTEQFDSVPSIVGDSFTRVPQFYIFGQGNEDTDSYSYYTNINLEVGTKGSIRGYVLAPGLNVGSGTNNNHPYSSTAEITSSSYPNFFGMLLCNYANFPSAASSYIKFDDRLNEPKEDDYKVDGVLDEEAYNNAVSTYQEIYNKYLKAIQGILVETGASDDSSDDADGSGDADDGGGSGDSGSTTTTWKIKIY
jgi:hypothetical protein